MASDEEIEAELGEMGLLDPPVCTICGNPCVPAAGQLTTGFLRMLSGWMCPDHPHAAAKWVTY